MGNGCGKVSDVSKVIVNLVEMEGDVRFRWFNLINLTLGTLWLRNYICLRVLLAGAPPSIHISSIIAHFNRWPSLRW